MSIAKFKICMPPQNGIKKHPFRCVVTLRDNILAFLLRFCSSCFFATLFSSLPPWLLHLLLSMKCCM
ncbi:hypothetical protein A4A49_53291 [Nicotiana attenuata]|uniref:Uncharacterized protein n=1 Tax=Nicotiana attenuata TaxID=49451 RepID=A0A1J6JPP1_NICAT|nr:hypothetical protein A4A49_64181 [Nicotiana attenuata]OIT29891.1 hypothetical protein A4A49_53291 [Nicotiana attenuata]